MLNVYTTTDPIDYRDHVYHDLSQGKEGVLIHVGNQICAWTGLGDPTFNKYEAERHNIEVLTGYRPGGTIVNMTGDITVCITKFGPSDVSVILSNKFVEFLKSKELNVTTDSNDILIDGKKVASWAGFNKIDKVNQQYLHFSVGKVDLELINAICTKPMVKVPGSLEEYGITTIEVYEWVCKELNELIPDTTDEDIVSE